MQINATTFGSITIDGKTYEHDVVIRLDGEVVNGRKSCQRSTTVHRTRSPKMKQSLSFRRDASNSFSAPVRWAICICQKGCKVIVQPTPEAIRSFNRSSAKKIGLFHVTC
jgi:hypothetical protein